MAVNIIKVKDFILDILFPKTCLNCQKEGSYLCYDCFSLIPILDRQYCPFCQKPKFVFDGKTCPNCRRRHKLKGLFCAADYKNFIVKKMIRQFKYEPLVKELAKPLSSLVLAHLKHLNISDFSDFLLVPVPLHERKLRERGFNPAEEIAKKLSESSNVPVLNNVLVKIKSTPAQAELKKEEREKNIKGVFSCLNKELVANKKILLVDDVFTTGATLEECACVLKNVGAKEIWGMVVARG